MGSSGNDGSCSLWDVILFQWLGYSKGYRAVVSNDFQLDDEVVALRGLDRARVDLHVPYIPDDGETHLQEHLRLAKQVQNMIPLFSSNKAD